MELEIRALQTQWHEIEDEVRSRDEFIDSLETELRTERSALDDLRSELDITNAALTAANEECARLAFENAEQIRSAESQEQQLKETQAELHEQQATAEDLQKKLDESSDELTRVTEASAGLAAVILDQQHDAEELTTKLNAAEKVLDEQIGRADTLQEYLDAAKSNLAELESNAGKLGAAEKALEEQIGRTETLQEYLDDAQSNLAELESNAGKFAADHQEQQQVTADQARQNQRLQAASIDMQMQIDDLAGYIAGRKSDWDAVQSEIALQSDANLSLQQAIAAKSETLELQKRENRMLLEEINKQRDESARLSAELSTNSDALTKEQSLRLEYEDALAAKTLYADELETANIKLTEMTSANGIMNDEMVKKNRELDQLRASLRQLETEHAESVTALRKQGEIIQHMENEVRSKLEAITIIGRKAQRNKGKPASIHRLDARRAKKSARQHAPGIDQTMRMIIALNDEQHMKYRIETGTMTIGRGKGNDIRLRHHFISRNHAQILTDADGSIIEDLGSKNGILVNAEPVNRRRLRDGDLVDIGEIQFKFIDPVNQTSEHKPH